MKKIAIISGIISVVVLVSCSDVKREPNRVYMPDMAYSRAYETYAERDTNFTSDVNDWESNGQTRIFYNNQPVAGTVSRGEDYVMHISKDATGDTANYVASRQMVSPLSSDSIPVDMVETERIFLINCGICHGTKLDGNGPLYKDGAGPYPAKPANLSGSDAKYVAMPDGQMFYSITYGRNLMGSYASQITPHQRWAIIKYIRSIQDKAKAPAAAATTGTPAAGKDSAAKK
ncbi:MAG: cytochrome c [Chitinophagaceae bacterium]